MKGIVAVIGDANIEKSPDKQKIAFELGKMIIENGYVLATGGMGGVMEYASKGARSASNYQANSIIGMIPTYNGKDANAYIDIPITTGLGMMRNTLLISTATAVIAIGGGSGTLNEISAAWQMNKLLIALKTEGWSGKLAGQSLDARRKDQIWAAETAGEAIRLLLKHYDHYQAAFTYSGIKKQRIKRQEAQQILLDHYKIDKLEFLGSGSEGYVFKKDKSIYKIIDSEDRPLDLYWNLLALSHRLDSLPTQKVIPAFQVELSDSQKYVCLRYPNQSSTDFLEGEILEEKAYLDFLAEMKRLSWVLADFQPKNLRKLNNRILMADLGHSLFPYSPYLFKSMCRRAFVTYKLQGKLSDCDAFKYYLTFVNDKPNFSQMAIDFEWDKDQLMEEFMAWRI